MPSTSPSPSSTAGPSGPRLAHLPALDGLRAVALIGVLLYHAGFGWMGGGFLGISTFFVLSGFLITSLLLSEWFRTGAIDLKAFWARRARRLVPGALVALVLVGAYITFATDGHVPGFRGDVLSSLTWSTNWRFILDERSYADAFADPSPMQHLWSLAVEEQFYLVMPLLALGLLAAGRGRRWPMAGVVVALALGSAVVTGLVHSPGDAPLRAYFGTDTRAAELLVGVLLALVLFGRAGLRRLSGPARAALDVGATVAAAVSLAVWTSAREHDNGLYQGGLAVMALLSALVIAAAVQPGTTVQRLLAARPLAALGRISYGVYLFHWPVFLWLSDARTGLGTVPRFGLQMAVTLGIAALSWRFLERPVRDGRLPARVALVGWANASTGLAAALVALSAGMPPPAVTLRASDAPLPPPPVVAPTSPGVEGEFALGATPTSVPPAAPTAAPAPAVTAAPGAAAPTTAAPPAAAPTTAAPVVRSAPPPPPTTAPPPPPVKVMVVGDSFGQNVATGLIRWSERGGPLAVWDNTIAGCTLARGGQRRIAAGQEWDIGPECGWWGTPEGGARLDRFDPDVVVVTTGSNEIYDRTSPQYEGWRHPGDPIYDAWLLSEYQAAADVFVSRGATVVWTVPPCCRHNPDWISQEDGAPRIRHLRDAVIPALAQSRSVRVADVYAQLCPGGAFHEEAYGLDDARPDGHHLSDVGAEAMAAQWLGPLILGAAGR